MIGIWVRFVCSRQYSCRLKSIPPISNTGGRRLCARERICCMVWSMTFNESDNRFREKVSVSGSSLWTAARLYCRVISAWPASSCNSREMVRRSSSWALTVWAVRKRIFSWLSNNSSVLSATRSSRKSRAWRNSSSTRFRSLISRDTPRTEVTSPAPFFSGTSQVLNQTVCSRNILALSTETASPVCKTCRMASCWCWLVSGGKKRVRGCPVSVF